ncbi:MAG: hypothetical protein AAGG48_09425 [Planctomycetota bacterium]
MAKRQTTMVLTAPAGTGKSYMVTRDVVREFLPNGAGKLYTNMPYGQVPSDHAFPPDYDGETFVDRMAQFCHDEYGIEKEDVYERIVLIPDDVLKSWQEGLSGPADYFDEIGDITSAWILIDEAHNYVGRHDGSGVKKLWQTFCGELRHRGASIQLVTQFPAKLAREVNNEAGMRQALIDAEEDRDPFFNIRLADWYELRAKWLGRYDSCFVRVDIRDIDGRKTKHSNKVRVKRSQEIFRLYDTHSAPMAGGVSASGSEMKREWQKRSWPSLLLWFVASNSGNFFKPLALAFAVVFFVAFGPKILSFGASRLAESAGAPSEDVTPPQPSAASVDVPVDDVTVELEDLRSRLQEFESRERENSVLRVLTRTKCTFADGIVYAVGDTIQVGPYEGQIIETIEWSSRSVLLSGGERVFLGDRWLQYAASSDAGTDQAALPARPNHQPTRARPVGTVQSGIDLRREAAARALREAASRRDRGVDRGRAEVGGRTGDAGSDSPGSRRSDSDGRPSLEHASNTDG